MLRLTLVLSLAALAACGPSRDETPAPVVYQGTQPSSEAPAQQAPAVAPAPVAATPGAADARGVKFYDGYQTVVARPGDSVDTMAARVGLSAAELAAYNGLTALYTPREGDELVLPARADEYRGGVVATAPAPQPAEPTEVAQQPAGDQEQRSSGWSPALVTAALDQSAEPTSSETAAPAEAAPEPLTQEETEPVQAAAPTPLVEERRPVVEEAVVEPEPPAPPQPQVAAAEASQRFLRPVDAPIARPFSKAPGPNRNDGVDFASPAGTPVRAAADGTVALVSKSLGGLGTIVLVRHEGAYLTVYGRVDNVALRRGDEVSQGQVIATVADQASPRSPALHFEVRRGAESVNPEDFI